MNKIKVMQVITQLPGGGVEQLLVDLLPQLNRDHFNISLCCIHKRGHLVDVLQARGVPVHLVKLNSRWDPIGIYRLTRLMQKEQIKIVHTHMYASSISGIVAARLAKVPVIIANMHSMHEWHTKRRIWTAKKLFNSADKIIAVSDCIKKDLIDKLKLEPQKTLTIHNGVDLARFTPQIEVAGQNENLDIKDDEFVIGAIGRLVAFKGFTYLLKAAKIIYSQQPKFKLVIVGGGELKQPLKQQAQELGIADKVIFTGRQDNVLPFLASFELVVMSSITEGLPIVSLEAMAMGKAVVASRVGGIPEVVEERVTGLLVPPKDPSALAQAIITLMENPELRKSLGQAGRARVEEFFSLQHMYEQTADLYTQLLKQKGIYEN